jgi:hypothetical protein
MQINKPVAEKVKNEASEAGLWTCARSLHFIIFSL